MKKQLINGYTNTLSAVNDYQSERSMLLFETDTDVCFLLTPHKITR